MASKKSTKKQNNNEANLGFEAKLWAAANLKEPEYGGYTTELRRRPKSSRLTIPEIARCF
jgi:hypothetical protein